MDRPTFPQDLIIDLDSEKTAPVSNIIDSLIETTPKLGLFGDFCFLNQQSMNFRVCCRKASLGFWGLYKIGSYKARRHFQGPPINSSPLLYCHAL